MDNRCIICENVKKKRQQGYQNFKEERQIILDTDYL